MHASEAGNDQAPKSPEMDRKSSPDYHFFKYRGIFKKTFFLILSYLINRGFTGEKTIDG